MEREPPARVDGSRACAGSLAKGDLQRELAVEGQASTQLSLASGPPPPHHHPSSCRLCRAALVLLCKADMQRHFQSFTQLRGKLLTETQGNQVRWKLCMRCRESIGLQGQVSRQVNLDTSMPAAQLLKPVVHKVLTEGFTTPQVSTLLSAHSPPVL